MAHCIHVCTVRVYHGCTQLAMHCILGYKYVHMLEYNDVYTVA